MKCQLCNNGNGDYIEEYQIVRKSPIEYDTRFDICGDCMKQLERIGYLKRGGVDLWPIVHALIRGNTVHANIEKRESVSINLTVSELMKRWDEEKRICHPNHFDTYFEIGKKLAKED